MSTLRTLNSRKSLFSRSSCFLSRTTSLEAGTGPDGPRTENLRTELQVENKYKTFQNLENKTFYRSIQGLQGSAGFLDQNTCSELSNWVHMDLVLVT